MPIMSTAFRRTAFRADALIASHSTRRRIGGGAMLAPLAALLVACGGGSGSNSGGDPVSANQPPVASFTSSTLTGVEPLSVTFDASASRDPDGTIRSYTWYPHGSSGYSVSSATSTFGPVIYEAGEYTIVLRVADEGGSTAQTTLRIVVAPGPRGDVEVRYRDRYDVPIAGLSVGVAPDAGGSRYATTDATGTALINSVIAGSACVGPNDGWGGVHPCNATTVVANQRTVLDLQFEYPAGPAGLVQSTRARIVDANTLDLEADLYVFNPGVDITPGAPPPEATLVLTEQGRLVHSAPSEAAAAFEYSIDPNTPARIEGVAGAATPTGYHAGVLVDVSGETPPTSSLLYATKEFLRTATAAERFVLAAFARSGSGTPALLPAQPVTLFPQGSPGFVADGNALFGEVDSLRALGGGTRPLYDAVDAMLDFMATHTPDGTRRALVVIAGNEDTTCGSAEACRRRLEATMARTLASGVELIYASRKCCSLPDAAALGQVGQGGTTRLDYEATTMRHLDAVLDGTAPRYRARLRLKAVTPGAFKAGRVLQGAYAVTLPQAVGSQRTAWLPFAIVL